MKKKSLFSFLLTCLIIVSCTFYGCSDFSDSGSILKIYEAADVLSQKSAYSLVPVVQEHELTGFAENLVVVPSEYNDINE